MDIYDDQDQLLNTLNNITEQLEGIEKEDPEFYAELVKICEDNKAT
jgi:hypothetical protein